MPELPEVETIVRDLRPNLLGHVISRAELIRPSVLRFGDGDALPFLLEGQRVEAVTRRGKFIHLRLGSGEHLVVHLGMTGTLTMAQPSTPWAVHTHLILDLDDGSQLRYRDPRRFGRVLLGQPAQLTRLGALPRLGPEPLSPGFASSGVAEILRNSSRQIKAALLDQALIAGCGNIYADEACFLARLRPTRRGSTLSRLEARRLLLALPVVMRAALRLRGSSFSDFRDGFGAKGEAHEALFVYGRGGLPCVRCGALLRQTRVGGRTTVYCQQCQR
ncbi:MAG: bifunctional DNA-formamidopyrimidine glycosylase/DNA-(apurinic or apyrimidinic site) lyase [Candidatus Dormiibacterota bacterium]